MLGGAGLESFGRMVEFETQKVGGGLELSVRQLRVCGSQLAVCLVSLFVSVWRSCVSSSSVPRPPIPRLLVFSLSPTVVHLSTYIHTGGGGCVCVSEYS